MKFKKGITIVYGKKLKEPDGTKRQVIDHIPPERDAIIVWKDQFGSVHGTSLGTIDNRKKRFDRVVERIAREYGMFPKNVED
jgi:hypothetical protein